MTQSGILRENGVLWAKSWFLTHGYPEPKKHSSTFYGNKNNQVFGICVFSRDHKIVSKPFEAITIQLSDAISIDKQFKKLNISRGFVLIARGFRESNNIRKDLSYFVKVPFPIIDRLIIKRSHLRKNPTLNIGFSEEQRRKWSNEGIEFLSMYQTQTGTINIHKSIPVPQTPSNPLLFSKEVTRTEIEQLIKARIGQSEFRKMLLQRDKKCVICGISQDAFLIASHIKPWSQSNHNERLDPNNGLLLCTIHDTIFDKGYISFMDTGSVLISPKLNSSLRNAYNITSNTKIVLSSQQCHYMKSHRAKFNSQSPQD